MSAVFVVGKGDTAKTFFELLLCERFCGQAMDATTNRCHHTSKQIKTFCLVSKVHYWQKRSISRKFVVVISWSMHLNVKNMV